MRHLSNALKGLAVTALASAMLLLLGVLYYMILVWIISVGASWAGYPELDGSMVVLTAGIVTAASMIGSAIQKT